MSLFLFLAEGDELAWLQQHLNVVVQREQFVLEAAEGALKVHHQLATEQVVLQLVELTFFFADEMLADGQHSRHQPDLEIAEMEFRPFDAHLKIQKLDPEGMVVQGQRNFYSVSTETPKAVLPHIKLYNVRAQLLNLLLVVEVGLHQFYFLANVVLQLDFVLDRKV